MSTLLFDRLSTGIVVNQKVKIARNVNLAHVRPWIYKQGTIQDGQFRLIVFDGVIQVAQSLITAEQINEALTLQYFHGFIRFDFDSLPLRLPEGLTTKEYVFRFEMINHTNDSANYIGLCRIWDNRIYTLYGNIDEFGNPPNDMLESVGLELYAHKYV